MPSEDRRMICLDIVDIIILVVAIAAILAAIKQLFFWNK